MGELVSAEPSVETFGAYRLEQVIARGGMGVVYAARGPAPAMTWVALKRLRADVHAVPAFVARFRRECQVAQGFRHPNLVRCLDFGAVGGVPYMVSELVEGPDLGALVRARGPLPEGLVLRVASDVAAGLEAIHRQKGLVHRDVAPGNVLIGPDGIAKLADFGLAKSDDLEEAPLTEVGTVLGTPRFLAPERLAESSPRPSSDIYSLGALMYHALAGSGPYREGGPQEVLAELVRGPPVPLASARPGLDPGVDRFVSWCMERSPVQRPADGARAHRALEAMSLLWPRERVVEWLGQGPWLAARRAAPPGRLATRAVNDSTQFDADATMLPETHATRVPDLAGTQPGAPTEDGAIADTFAPEAEPSWEELASPARDRSWVLPPDDLPAAPPPRPSRPVAVGAETRSPPAVERRKPARPWRAVAVALAVVGLGLGALLFRPGPLPLELAERLGAASVRVEDMADRARREDFRDLLLEVRQRLRAGENSAAEVLLESLERRLDVRPHPAD